MKRIIYIFIAVIILMFQSCNYFKGRENRFKQEELSGIVIGKYFDKWNHKAPMLKLKNGQNIGINSWNNKSEDIWYYIEIGDSIYKGVGKLDLDVIKPSGYKKTFRYLE